MWFCAEREPVVAARREVADVERAREAGDLHDLPLRKKTIGDSPLIEHFDRARMQPACACASELLALTPLDDRDIDPRQREFAR